MVYEKKKSEGHCERQNPTVSYQSFTSVSFLNLILLLFGSSFFLHVIYILMSTAGIVLQFFLYYQFCTTSMIYAFIRAVANGATVNIDSRPHIHFYIYFYIG